MPSARHISLLHPSPTTETHPVTLPSHQPPSQATAKPPGEKKEQRRRRRRRHKTYANISALVQPRIPGLPVKTDNETRPRLGQGGQQHQRFKTGPEKGGGRRVQNKNTHSLCNTSVALAASWRLHVSSLSFSWAVFGQSVAGAAAGWPSPSWKSLSVWVFSGGDIAHIDHLVGTDLEALS